ncbi:MAG: poly(R)-hydroxyalkanoic acid synthase subunit PhaE [Rhodoblastus sp.]
MSDKPEKSDKSDTSKTDKAKAASKPQQLKGPLDAFRDFVGQWERGVNQFANEAMGNEQFSRLMAGATSAAAGAKAGLGDAMERYLTTINLPTRADIVTIGERLQAIEAQLARLTEILAHMAPAEAAPTRLAAKPKRTRKPAARAPSASTANGGTR